ncbi:MAG: DUF4080 domain-containing protein [Lachnospiraceae bacterium]|nr:DUF4080 domain-containing protein [Lachnospiraceae bacterium]
MKILLVGINTKYIHTNPAVYYLRGYVLNEAENRALYENSMEIAEYTINMDKDAILRDLYLKNADVYCFSCYLWNIDLVDYLMRELSKLKPSVKIWIGGPEVSFDAVERLEKEPYITGIIRGEGEKSFYLVAEDYIEGKGEISGIIDSPNMDLDDVPFPYDDLSAFDGKIVYYESSRGCPFKCAYCLSSVDRHVRLRSMDLVEKELKAFLDAKVPLVKFVDRTFNVNKEHTRRIIEFIRDNDNGLTSFHFEIAAELVDEEDIRLFGSLRRGAAQLEIGVQTTNKETLKAINRNSDIEKLKRIVKSLQDNKNMHIHLDLIAGLPYEDMESFKRSFNEVYLMHGDQLQLGFLKVLKGSPMEERIEDYKLVYSELPPYEVHSTKWLSYGDIIELKEVEEMLETYHNSGQYTNILEYVEKVFPDPYSIYKGLADYYKENGYAGLAHNRYEKYSILRDFLISNYPADEEEITERILIDLYLRENVKSRPDYGQRGLIPKDEYNEFFKSGRYKEYLPGYADHSSVQSARLAHIEKVKDGYLIFDYSAKDVITGDARTVLVKSLS